MSEDISTPPHPTITEAVHELSNPLSQTSLLKLDIDCFEALFEWLSLANLRSLRQTCRRLNVIATYYIQLKYPKALGNLEICDTDAENLRQYDARFCRLYKHIKFDYCPLSADIIFGIKHILCGVEKVTIANANIDGDFHEEFLQYCTNLKCLFLSTDFASIDVGRQWLFQRYPKLERFVLMVGFEDAPELRIFFEKNPNIRRFSTTAEFIHENSEWMLESNIKLDVLDIQVICRVEDGMDHICNILNLLHQNGIYQQLNLNAMSVCDQDDINQIGNLEALNQLYLECMFNDVIPPPMTQVKTFCVDDDQDIENIDKFVDSLENVERIYFECATFQNLVVFLNRCSKLKEVKIRNPKDCSLFNDGVIDLRRLNEERQKCGVAGKVLVYVREDDFLNIKFEYGDTSLDYVELNRIEYKIWDNEI